MKLSPPFFASGMSRCSKTNFGKISSDGAETNDEHISSTLTIQPRRFVRFLILLHANRRTRSSKKKRLTTLLCNERSDCFYEQYVSNKPTSFLKQFLGSCFSHVITNLQFKSIIKDSHRHINRI